MKKQLLILLSLSFLASCSTGIDLSSLPVYTGDHDFQTINKGENFIRCTDEAFSKYICLLSPITINGRKYSSTKIQSFLKTKKISKGIDFENMPIYRADHLIQGIRKSDETILCSDERFSKALCVKPPISIGKLKMGASQIESVVKFYGK